MKVIFSERERELEQVKKRMDRFDSLIHEYLRANRKTVDQFCLKVGCDPSTLWRYRRKPESFEKIPLEVIGKCFRTVNISNENLRYILGL